MDMRNGSLPNPVSYGRLVTGRRRNWSNLQHDSALPLRIHPVRDHTCGICSYFFHHKTRSKVPYENERASEEFIHAAQEATQE